MIFFATIWAVAVFCGPGLGRSYYNLETEKIVLSRDVCAPLKDAPTIRSGESAFSVFVLAHEEGHAHDTRNHGVLDIAFLATCSQPGPCEAYADCYGAGHMIALAHVFGYSGYAAKIMLRQIHRARMWIGYSPIPQRCFTQRGGSS